MAKYAVEISEDVQVEIDVSPGAGPLSSVTLGWETSDANEFVRATQMLGFDLDEMNPANADFYRFGLPLTSDGEWVGAATVRLRATDDLADPGGPPPPPRPRLERALGFARAARNLQAHGGELIDAPSEAS